MKTETWLLSLRWALIVIGLTFVFGIYLMMHFFPASWGWEPPQYKYEQMIQGVYATLGVFLLLAARDPLANKSLIWFTVWSSFVHATIMLLQAFHDPREYPNLLGDIPGLYIIAIVLGALMVKASKETSPE